MKTRKEGNRRELKKEREQEIGRVKGKEGRKDSKERGVFKTCGIDVLNSEITI